MNKGNLFVISGPSGTGKGTICDILIEDENIFLSISSTSREKRAGETDGVTYNYTTREDFERMIESDEVLEWAQYDGNYYGTPKKTVEKMLDDGKNVILEIDVQGALKVKKIFPETVLIFIVPPSMKELKNRLVARGREDGERIEKRLTTALSELKLADRYNYILVNDNIDECVRATKNIIEKTTENKKIILDLLNEKLN